MKSHDDIILDKSLFYGAELTGPPWSDFISVKVEKINVGGVISQNEPRTIASKQWEPVFFIRRKILNTRTGFLDKKLHRILIPQDGFEL